MNSQKTFSQDSTIYRGFEYIAPNTLSKYDTVMRLFTPQIIVLLSNKVTHTAKLNEFIYSD